MEKYTEYEKNEIKKALEEELSFLKKEGLDPSEGAIGIESLHENGGYAYAAQGGYGNCALYISIKTANDILK